MLGGGGPGGGVGLSFERCRGGRGGGEGVEGLVEERERGGWGEMDWTVQEIPLSLPLSILFWGWGNKYLRRNPRLASELAYLLACIQL